MNRRTENFMQSTLLQMIGWAMAAGLFSVLRYGGLQHEVFLSQADLSRLDFGYLVWSAAAAGAVIGLAYGLLDLVLERPRLRRLPYGFLIATQTGFHLLIMALVLSVITAFDVSKADGSLSWEGWSGVMFSSFTGVILLYTSLVSFTFNFVKQVNRKSGPGNLMKLLLGKYYHPREERRIFMFLDLKDSTAYAEQLGHLRFSRLIQSCFHDLSVVARHRAQVYQYVGDEVILCWEVDEGVEDANCVRSFFEFTRLLRERENVYRQNFGLVPEFKAGIHIGPATVAEVGEIKREISYLGDTLNTAARLQGKCNELQESVLVSSQVLEVLGRPRGLRFESKGCLQLKGKDEPVVVYGVHQTH